MRRHTKPQRMPESDASHPSKQSSRQRLCSEPCLFELFLEADGTYIMEAEVNRAATFTIKFRLSTEEVAQFQSEGEAFAKTLALRVDSFPDHFNERAI